MQSVSRKIHARRSLPVRRSGPRVVYVGVVITAVAPSGRPCSARRGLHCPEHVRTQVVARDRPARGFLDRDAVVGRYTSSAHPSGDRLRLLAANSGQFGLGRRRQGINCSGDFIHARTKHYV